MALSLSFGAQASLTSSGSLTVFDSTQNLTWTKDANLNGQMDWTTAVTWANNLDYAGYTDWVLPHISQLTYQFSTNLGVALGSIAASHNDSYNLFTNVQNYAYWSGSLSQPDDPFTSWDFYSNVGFQHYSSKDGQLYAWAVPPGDFAAVPVPGAFWLFGSAMVGLIGLKRRGSIG